MKKKMQWLIDAINSDSKDVLNKTLKFRISNSGKSFGTVCMPTGTGKSGVMIEDIVDYCLHRYNPGRKTVINLSCPTLKLAEQLVTDLFETLCGVRNGNLRINSCLVLNSSDSPYNYNTYGCPVYSGDLYGAIRNASDDGYTIIIVASCHKSLQKFVPITENLRIGADILNYIDESHLVPFKSWYFEEDGCRVDLQKLRKGSKALYLFSATPDYAMTKEISDSPDCEYIYKLYPFDAISENIILPPRIRCIRCEKTIDTGLYTDLLNECKEFGGFRKVLITMRNTEDMRILRHRLEFCGYKVFSASAADGFTGGDGPIKDAVTFADKVDEWDGDCFVLQIKQLTQGTDIRTLTDCVIPVANEINPKTYRTLIQTMGRVLRAAPGERGMSYESRTKKAGNIFFLLDPETDSAKELCMRRFALRYYGMECALYGERFRMPSEMTGEIESTKHKIRDYVLDMADSIKININMLGSSVEAEASSILEAVDPAQYYGKRKSSSIPEYHLLDNRSLLEYAKNLIESTI